MKRMGGLALVAALCAAPSLASAVETATAQQGLALARGVCASCHGVEWGDVFSPNVMAPTFEEVAETPGMTATALSVSLHTSHRLMPDIRLSSEEVAAITAYILSLKDGQ